ncbi:hypothetical protein PCL1606_31040 [Pseudomonas chlororaphis]|uniref:Uncharacterized protein n=1 Tax=Pseudomonas chlororaphis TaxID=587753 RepID=A0A0D5Y0G8_9PSED|nr:hypothetical protein PCL1606_31040 [Pseudomonas chlororaphis]
MALRSLRPCRAIAASLVLDSGYMHTAPVAAAEPGRGCDRQRSCRET